MGGTLFFAANDPEYGNELWKSDGTAFGTGIVKDINLRPGVSGGLGARRRDLGISSLAGVSLAFP